MLERRNKLIEFKKDRRISVTILAALIGTIAAIITGLRCIDILTERSQIV